MHKNFLNIILLFLLILPISTKADSDKNGEFYINSNTQTTSNRNVVLNFKASSNVSKIKISNSKNFKYTMFEKYQKERNWNLCSRYNGVIKLPICEDGNYVIYVKFYDSNNSELGQYYDDIILKNDFNTSGEVLITKQDNEHIVVPKEVENKIELKPAKIDFTKDLKVGSISSEAKALQEFLNENNYIIAMIGVGSSGRETAYFGNLTKKALIKFQGQYLNDITNKGSLDSKTREFINELRKPKDEIKEIIAGKDLPSAIFTRSLGVEMKGEDVRRLQQLLASVPKFYPEGVVSGYYGKLTENAVKRFQDEYKIATPSHPAYGYTGPATRAKLKEVFN